MRSGALREPIVIQHRTQTSVNDLNEPVFTWATFRSPFADISTRRGIENFDTGSQQRYSETVYRFRVRFEEARGADATMLILYDDKTFQITSMLPDYSRKEDVLIEAILQNGTV